MDVSTAFLLSFYLVWFPTFEPVDQYTVHLPNQKDGTPKHKGSV